MIWLRRLTVWSAWVLTLLVVVGTLLLGGLWWLLQTESGTRWGVQRGLGLIEGAHATRIEGTLLDGLVIEGLHLPLASATVDLDTLHLRVIWQTLFTYRLTVPGIQAQGLRVQLHPAPATEPEPPPFDFHALPDLHLPVSIALPHVQVDQLQLILASGAEYPIERITLAASTDETRLFVQSLAVTTADGQVRLGGNVGFAFPYALDLWLDLDHALPTPGSDWLDGAQRLQGDLRVVGSVEQPVLQPRLQAPLTLQGDVTLQPFRQHLPLSGSLSWQPFVLTPPAEETDTDQSAAPAARRIGVAAGRLELTGSLQQYRFQLDSGSQMEGLPPLQFQARGQGSLESLEQLALHLVTDQGEARLAGQVRWQPHLSWQLDVDAERLDPSLLVPQLPASLTLKARTEGSLQQDALALSLQLEQLGGTLRQQPVSGHGHLSWSNQRLNTDLRVQLGPNRVHLAGQAGERLDLRADLAARDLSRLWPGLAGQVSGQLQAGGTLHSPHLRGTLTAPQIRYQQWQLEGLRLVSTGADTRHSDLRLTLDRLNQQGTALIQALQLSLSGRLEQHRLSLQVRHEQEQLALQAEGELLERSRWRGRLQQLSLDSPQLDRWQLQQPAALDLSAERVEVAPLCLRNLHGTLCGNGLWQPDGERHAQLRLQQFPLLWFLRFLPFPNAQLSGELDLAVDYHQPAGRPAQALARLQVGAGRFQPDPQVSRALPWDGLLVSATLEDRQVNGQLDLDLPGVDQLAATLQLGLDDQQLAGRLQGSLRDFHLLELMVPSLRRPRGALSADLHLSGTLPAPQLSGQVRLEDVAADLPELGLQISDSHVLATLSEQGWLDVEGTVRTGAGELTLTGDGDLRNLRQPDQIQLNLDGTDVLVTHRSDVEVRVDPQLRILWLSQQGLQVRGRVDVPLARVELDQLPASAVGVSRDEVILNQKDEAGLPLPLDLMIDLQLGRAVTFEGFGLNARFGGQLRLEQKPGQTARLFGDVVIREGRFRAYGQRLTVEQGTLYFQGPADNPGLNIAAVRNVPQYNVKAGLRIEGTLQDPRSTLFSEPAMEETEVMSFLLTGKPLDGASDRDSALIMQAIALWGLEKGAAFTGGLTSELGVDVGVDSEGDFEDTALMLGKQLSDRLYLRYSVGLFEAVSTVMLRYTINRHLSLETRSSTREQAVDLIYRRER